MLSAISNRNMKYNPSFCRTQKFLLVDDKKDYLDILPLILGKIKSDNGDTVEFDPTDSYKDAINKIDSENYDGAIFDGEIRSDSGLNLAKYAIVHNRIARENIILNSGNPKLRPFAENKPLEEGQAPTEDQDPPGLGICFIEKGVSDTYKQLIEKTKEILNRNSSVKFDKKA